MDTGAAGSISVPDNLNSAEGEMKYHCVLKMTVLSKTFTLWLKTNGVNQVYLFKICMCTLWGSTPS